jgi:hypothetical protein
MWWMCTGTTVYSQSGTLSALSAQSLRASEDTLALLAYAVVNDSAEAARFGACKVLIKKLVQALKTENSFQYPFDRLRSVSILAPPDSSFRIFTWQLFVNDSTYKYYGAIQMNQPTLKLYPLIDRSTRMEAIPPRMELSPEKWQGMLYYNLRQFDTREGRKYLLFGYDVPDFFSRRKTIEVLSFRGEDRRPVFGAPVFKKAGKARQQQDYRLVFEYAADGSVRVNWDEQYQMVIFDHLLPVPSPYGRGLTYVTDGSYDGLRPDKNGWLFVEKVFSDFQDEAPRPEPVLDSRKSKDLFGKPVKQR